MSLTPIRKTFTYGAHEVTLETKVAARFQHGQAVSVGFASGSVAVFGEDGTFLGTGEVDAGGTLQPKRLLAPRRTPPKSACGRR